MATTEAEALVSPLPLSQFPSEQCLMLHPPSLKFFFVVAKKSKLQFQNQSNGNQVSLSLQKEPKLSLL
jgi:hypothetical protein